MDAAEKQKVRVLGDDGGRVDTHAAVGERKPLLAVVGSAVRMAIAFAATGDALIFSDIEGLSAMKPYSTHPPLVRLSTA